MNGLSSQQEEIVGLPLGPICVSACAGSGKTRTAVHRLARMRQLLDDRHGIVALLSFSNVAVDTFRRDYREIVQHSAPSPRSHDVEIDTVDAFITSNVIRPHAFKAMRATRTPFLVLGKEPFLRNFTVFDGSRLRRTADLEVSVENDNFSFAVKESYNSVPISSAEAEKGLRALGSKGAYTHSSGRYWAIRTLKEHPYVLRAMARRYPIILVDEAQDIGTAHQLILEMLVGAGSQLSLIGDTHQGIYNFSGASGAFLTAYGARDGVKEKGLTINYRSVPSIVSVANKLSGRNDDAERTAPETLSGAFYLPYKKNEKAKLTSAFQTMLDKAAVQYDRAVILCRSTDWVSDWRGGEEDQGQGTVRSFVEATICRDKLHRFDDCFDQTCAGVIALLADGHGDLASAIARNTTDPMIRRLRRIIWAFARNPTNGLPAGSLLADTEWHPALSERVKGLLKTLESELGLKPADNIGNKLAKRQLLNKPIIQATDLATGTAAFHVSTVHQVKGQSIDAVMYVANRAQTCELLDGTATEVGKIGYVALTRAKNLFLLGVPDSCAGELEARLEACGFTKPTA